MKNVRPAGDFEFTRWGNEGLGDMAPLWMLKYLPNMPASHIAIYNDLRGPNNSLTMREAAGNLAIGEAFRTIQRGHANLMVAGATGTRILPMQAIHALQTEQMAAENCDPDQGQPAVRQEPHRHGRRRRRRHDHARRTRIRQGADGATIYAKSSGLGSANVADDKLHRQVRRRPRPRHEIRPPRRRQDRPPTSATSTPTASARPTATPTKPARSAKSSARSPTMCP